MKRDPTSRYVLSADVMVTPVTQLSSSLREKFEHLETDFAITKRNSRQRSKIIDSRTGLLISAFKTPRTLVDGLTDFATAVNEAPEDLIDSAGAILMKLIDASILTVEDSPESKRTSALFSAGDSIERFRVERVIQVIDDSEVYDGVHGTRRAVLKIARSRDANNLINSEADVLRKLPPQIGPELIDTGLVEGRTWLLMEWLEGSSPTKVARQLRAQASFDGTSRLLSLCNAILHAYATLHSLGFLHGDLHPKNILVSSDAQVRLIDFGLASYAKHVDTRRGGIEAYYEPEAAKALLAGKKMPPNTAAAEQYALAALLYELLTGASYLHFGVEKTKMLRQIAEDAPVPFAMRGLFGQLQVQRVLERGLAKGSLARFGSVADFAEAFRRACHQVPSGRAARLPSGNQDAYTQAFLNNTCQIDGELLAAVFHNSPSCSVNHGAAGIAYALYRIAMRLEDSKVLSFADLWIQRALAALEDDGAFFNSSLDLLPRTIGKLSLYHGPAGVHCVHALISGALGDFISQKEAIATYLQVAQQDTENADLTIGRSGLLLGTILLLDAAHGNSFVDSSELQASGDRLFNGIWKRPGDGAPSEMLGIAHGSAGMVYAALRWCRMSGASIPARAQAALEDLSRQAEQTADGIRWRRLRRGNDYVPSWCNGAAGFVYLWTEAFRLTANERYFDLALGAAQTAWKDSDSRASLCCGFAGRAYALLNFFKHSGEGQWVDAARTLATRARETSGYSLYNGTPGSVLLTTDLATPEAACMPLFESDQAL